MDAPGLDPAVYARVLHDHARVNRWTSTVWSSISFLGGLGSVRAQRVRLLDVGFGSVLHDV